MGLFNIFSNSNRINRCLEEDPELKREIAEELGVPINQVTAELLESRASESREDRFKREWRERFQRRERSIAPGE